jgi:hypothetical protein
MTIVEATVSCCITSPTCHFNIYCRRYSITNWLLTTLDTLQNATQILTIKVGSRSCCLFHPSMQPECTGGVASVVARHSDLALSYYSKVRELFSRPFVSRLHTAIVYLMSWDLPRRRGPMLQPRCTPPRPRYLCVCYHAIPV